MTSLVGHKGNGPKTTRTGNLQPCVTFGEKLKLIGGPMPSGSGYICEETKNPLLETGSSLSFWQQWSNI